MYKLTTTAIITLLFLISCVNPTEQSEKSVETKDDATIIETMDGEIYLFAGTYTSAGGSEGIYVYKFNTNNGSSDSLSMVKVNNPSYLTLSSDGNFVYSVEEDDQENSSVHSFSFDKERGILTPINSQSTLGSGPCYITIDNKDANIHTANYGGGSISSFSVNNDGSLMPANSVLVFDGSGPVSKRQENSHLHSIQYSPDGEYIFAADLGADKIYRFNVFDTPFQGQPSLQEASLKEFTLPEGTGPRHFVFHPYGGRYLYVLGELSGQIIAFDYNNGEITKKQTIVADSLNAQGSADIHISPDGRFLYASNRLEGDGLTIFSINQEDGILTKLGYQPTGKHPRNFVITPNGKYLLVACRDDDKIQVFDIDEETGLLSTTGKDIMISDPVCLIFADH